MNQCELNISEILNKPLVLSIKMLYFQNVVKEQDIEKC